jgi:hypothetical protein
MIEKIGNLLPKTAAPSQPTRRTERGDLLDTFLSRLNPLRLQKNMRPVSYGRLSFILTAIPTPDLYALLSKCNDAERRGYAWSAIFWLEIKPQLNKI